jgi:hypothetical protein
MNRKRLWRWVLLCPLLYGCLAGMSCMELAKNAALNGTIQFVSGQVGSTFGAFPISDLIIGLITGQSTGGTTT